MGERILYKYLDVNGGLATLKNHNLQFTNVSKFNDPFDCHPALFEYKNMPDNERKWYGEDFLMLKGKTDMENLRNGTWMCCLSKVYDSLLMWAYYNCNKGICIGLNKDAVLESLNKRFFGFMFPTAKEVKYKDILQKPDYFDDRLPLIDLWTTKAKVWEHEQEVRIITQKPAWVKAERTIPKEFQKDELVDGREVRYYPIISGDCFESVYLGVNIHHRHKDEIINAAKGVNPNIKIYQMTIDPEALKLKEEMIEI